MFFLLLHLISIDLPNHFDFFEGIFQVISFIVSLDKLFFPILVLFTLRESHKIIFFNGNLFLEFALDLLGNFILNSLLSGLVVIDKVVSVPPDKVGLSTFLLKLLSSLKLVLLGKSC
jgi:hypothetical protein